jgi:DNA-directed RNA polymerase specialized sigma subunit
MAKVIEEKHRILREVFRHYTDFYDYYKRTGRHTIEHKGVTLSFLDLHRVLENTNLSTRKREAFYLHVLQDKKQKDVAEIMKITTVSVGQYVDAACRQLAEHYFTDEEWGDEKKSK